MAGIVLPASLDYLSTSNVNTFYQAWVLKFLKSRALFRGKCRLTF